MSITNKKRDINSSTIITNKNFFIKSQRLAFQNLANKDYIDRFKLSQGYLKNTYLFKEEIFMYLFVIMYLFIYPMITAVTATVILAKEMLTKRYDEDIIEEMRDSVEEKKKTPVAEDSKESIYAEVK